MQTYSEMVDSELTYLGMIPRSWRLTPASMLFNENRQNNQSLISQTPLQFKMGNIIRKNIDVDDKLREEIKRYTVVDKNDIMVNGLNLNYDFATQRVALVGERGCITPAYIALRTRKNYLPRYANYLLKALDGQKVLNGWGTGIRLTLNFTEFKKYRLPEPNTETQQKIADFLDTETAQIDNLIAKQERLLELLEEKRRATITHAVTRGLNPSVELKETNIPWLGQIPVHWELYRAKYLFEKIQEKPLDTDEVVTAFRDGEVVLRSLRREDGFTFADKEIGYQHVSVGDLVIHAMDAFAGAVGVSKSEGKMSPVCSICRPIRSGVDTEYYAQLVRAMTSTNYLVAIAKGIRERSTDFRFGDFSNMTFPLPPLDEQRGIISRINDENEKVAKLKQKIQTQITLLRERRTSLISHAVTGKIRV